jgi:hypothetical protein
MAHQTWWCMSGYKFWILVLKTWVSELLTLLSRCIIGVVRHQSMCLVLMLFSNKPSIGCKDNVLIKAITKLNDAPEKRFFSTWCHGCFGCCLSAVLAKSSCEVTFLVHMAILKGSYCPLKKLESAQTWIPLVLDVNLLHLQSSYFKIKMMFNVQWAMD